MKLRAILELSPKIAAAVHVPPWTVPANGASHRLIADGQLA